MPANDESGESTLSLRDLEVIDTICGRFEEAWQATGPQDAGPSLDWHLEGVADHLRSALLEELWRIDREYRAIRARRPKGLDRSVEDAL
ncbi:MAG: hypothetical protein AB7I30_17645 [Isosphaeraceae bacterium]